MNTMKVALIAFPGASKEVIKRGEEILKSKLGSINVEIDNTNPEALFVVSGGSENHAKSILQNSKRMLILAMTENNSYAAASEIKSYCNQNAIDSVLYNIDNEMNLLDKIHNYIKSNNALNNLSKTKIGLIGEVSEWLISSDINKEILKEKLGLELEKVSWNDFPKYDTFPVNTDFLKHFSDSGFNLEDSSRVYNLLQVIITKKQLDAITVECFPLVQESKVTACLALSLFNTKTIAAGCEGDITSIAGKLVVKELTNQVPWMANIAGIEDDKVFFAHCTIATNLVSDYKINTHFETNEGTAVQGQFKSENVTVFRLNNELNKAFLSYGRIVDRPDRNDSCRTQIKVEIPTTDIQKLKNNPLGNHHLIIPGDHRESIEFFLNMIQIKLV
jgi:L-fucose isomerase-like protein